MIIFPSKNELDSSAEELRDWAKADEALLRAVQLTEEQPRNRETTVAHAWSPDPIQFRSYLCYFIHLNMLNYMEFLFRISIFILYI